VRSGSVSSKSVQSRPWWPEEICATVDKIMWMICCRGDPEEDWHQLTAYDAHGRMVGVSLERTVPHLDDSRSRSEPRMLTEPAWSANTLPAVEGKPTHVGARMFCDDHPLGIFGSTKDPGIRLPP
jgi:hypothetical protein